MTAARRMVRCASTMRARQTITPASTLLDVTARATALVGFVRERETAETAGILAFLMTTFEVSKETAKRDLRAAVKAGRLVAAEPGARVPTGQRHEGSRVILYRCT